MINPASHWENILGIFFGILTMYFACHAMVGTNIYCYFSAPIATVSKKGRNMDGTPHISYWRGFVVLFAVYFAVSVTMALTGGTIGMTLPDWKPEYSANHILWGFSSGLLAVALARISAVYMTTAFAAYLQLLTIFALGACAYWFVVDRFNVVYNSQISFFTKYVDNVVRPSGNLELLVYSIASVLFALVLVECLIYLHRKLGSANNVPYALLTERVQQHAQILQLFCPTQPESFTDKKIKAIIESKEGLQEILWLTHSPPKHLESIRDAVITHYGISNQQAHLLMNERSKIKVILTQPILQPECISNYLDAKNIKMLGSPTRARYMIINCKYAIVHLPIPYQGDAGEQSNCAHYIKSPAMVAMWREKFRDLWDSLPPMQSHTELDAASGSGSGDVD